MLYYIFIIISFVMVFLIIFYLFFFRETESKDPILKIL